MAPKRGREQVPLATSDEDQTMVVDEVDTTALNTTAPTDGGESDEDAIVTNKAPPKKNTTEKKKKKKNGAAAGDEEKGAKAEKDQRTKETDTRSTISLEEKLLEDPQIELMESVLGLDRLDRGGDFSNTLMLLAFGLDRSNPPEELNRRNLLSLRVIRQLSKDDEESHSELKLFINNALTALSLETAFNFTRPSFPFLQHQPFFGSIYVGEYDVQVVVTGQSNGQHTNCPRLEVKGEPDMLKYYKELSVFFTKLTTTQHEYDEVVNYSPPNFLRSSEKMHEFIMKLPTGNASKNKDAKEDMKPVLARMVMWLFFISKHLSQCGRCYRAFASHNEGSRIEEYLSILTSVEGLTRYRTVHVLDTNTKEVCAAGQVAITDSSLCLKHRENRKEDYKKTYYYYRTLANNTLPFACQYLPYQRTHFGFTQKQRLVFVDPNWASFKLLSSSHRKLHRQQRQEANAAHLARQPRKGRNRRRRDNKKNDLIDQNDQNDQNDQDDGPSTSGPAPSWQKAGLKDHKKTKGVDSGDGDVKSPQKKRPKRDKDVLPLAPIRRRKQSVDDNTMMDISDSPFAAKDDSSENEDDSSENEDDGEEKKKRLQSKLIRAERNSRRTRHDERSDSSEDEHGLSAVATQRNNKKISSRTLPPKGGNNRRGYDSEEEEEEEELKLTAKTNKSTSSNTPVQKSAGGKGRKSDSSSDDEEKKGKPKTTSNGAAKKKITLESKDNGGNSGSSSQKSPSDDDDNASEDVRRRNLSDSSSDDENKKAGKKKDESKMSKDLPKIEPVEDPTEDVKPEIAHNTKIKFFGAMQSLIYFLDTCSLSDLQSKIHQKIQEIEGSDKVILDYKIIRAVKVLIAQMANHSTSQLPRSVESVSFCHFLSYLKTSIRHSKLVGMESLLQEINEKIEKSQNEIIPVEEVVTALQAAIDVDNF